MAFEQCRLLSLLRRNHYFKFEPRYNDGSPIRPTLFLPAVYRELVNSRLAAKGLLILITTSSVAMGLAA